MLAYANIITKLKYFIVRFHNYNYLSLLRYNKYYISVLISNHRLYELN